MIYYHLWIRRRDFSTKNKWTKYHTTFTATEEHGIEDQVSKIEAESKAKVLEIAGLETKIIRSGLAKAQPPEI